MDRMLLIDDPMKSYHHATQNPTHNHVIPAELRARKQWLTWFYSAKGEKIPRGKSNDQTTWQHFKDLSGSLIAYVISTNDPYTGIDIDNCLDLNRNIRPWAQPIIDRFAHCSYAEYSPSGTGIKLLTKATKTAHKCKYFVGADKQQVELYEHGRFWTITKQCIGDAYRSIADGQSAVEWLQTEYLPKISAQKQSLQVGQRGQRLQNGHLFTLSTLSNELSPDQFERILNAIDETLPFGHGQRNDGIFRYARKVVAILRGRPAPQLSQKLADMWFEKALPMIKTKDKGTTRIDFEYAVHNVRKPDTGDPIEAACQYADEIEPPPWPCVEGLDPSEPLFKLAKLVRAMHDLHADDNGVWYLPCRSAASYIGVDFQKANRLLDRLDKLKLIQIVKRGKQGPPGSQGHRFKLLASQ